MSGRHLLIGLLVCLVLAGCGGTTTVTTTTNPGPPQTVTSISRAQTGQSWVATYGAAISAVVALTIALSGTFAFLRRPRLTLHHNVERFAEDRVPAGSTAWWWRLRVSNAERRWRLVPPRTAQDVEVFVIALRRIPRPPESHLDPVVSGRRLPWTIPPDDKDEAAPVRIPAGTFRYLSVVGPRRGTDDSCGSPAAMPLKPPPDRSDAGRYDLAAAPGSWEAEIVVSAEDVRATHWLLRAEVSRIPDPGDVAEDAVKITVRRKRAACLAIRRADPAG